MLFITQEEWKPTYLHKVKYFFYSQVEKKSQSKKSFEFLNGSSLKGFTIWNCEVIAAESLIFPKISFVAKLEYLIRLTQSYLFP